MAEDINDVMELVPASQLPPFLNAFKLYWGKTKDIAALDASHMHELLVNTAAFFANEPPFELEYFGQYLGFFIGLLRHKPFDILEENPQIILKIVGNLKTRSKRQYYDFVFKKIVEWMKFIESRKNEIGKDALHNYRTIRRGL